MTSSKIFRRDLNWTICLLLALGGFALLGGWIAMAQSNCVSPPQTNPRWPRDRYVYYMIASELSSYQSQILAAINGWNTANTANNSGVQFRDISMAPAGTTPQMTIVRSNTRTNAGWTDQTSTNTTLTMAVVHLNPDSGAFAAGQSGSANFWTKVMSHELGHTMGLGEAAGDCSSQPNGGSVMNMSCGTNDSQGNMASSPTSCDRNTVQMVYPQANYQSGYNYYTPTNSPNCDVSYVQAIYYWCSEGTCTTVGSDFFYQGVVCN